MNTYNLRSKTNAKLTYKEQEKERNTKYSFNKFKKNLKNNNTNTPDNIYYKAYINYISNNKCNWCGNTELLRIDHEHNTGRYRGCLCNDCNSVEGRIKNMSDEFKLKYLTGYNKRGDDRTPWNIYQAQWIIDTWYKDGGMLGKYTIHKRKLRNRNYRYAI